MRSICGPEWIAFRTNGGRCGFQLLSKRDMVGIAIQHGVNDDCSNVTCDYDVDI